MKPNHDVFVGQEFWVQHRVGFFPAAKSYFWLDDIPPLASCSRPIMVSDSPPRRVHVKQQADVIHRDKLMTKEDKKIRRKAILQRNWREPINVDAVNQLPSETSKLPIDAATTVATIANYPHQTRLAGVTMPSSPVPLVKRPERSVVTIAEISATPVSMSNRDYEWLKTFDGKNTPIPQDENPEHIDMVHRKPLRHLRHLDGSSQRRHPP